jgi:lipoprotein-releasing system permease protein
VVGVAIGTAALILVLSVFNGFEDLLSGLFGHFNPEIKVVPAKGKTFPADSVLLGKIRALPGAQVVSTTLEEIAFFSYGDAQDFGVLKGVDAAFARVNDIDSTVAQGDYLLRYADGRPAVVVGAGMHYRLGVDVRNPIETITIYTPDQDGGGALDKSFKTRLAYPAGIFSIQVEIDNEYVLADIDYVREMLGADSTEVSALEIRCTSPQSRKSVKNALKSILGDGFSVKDHYEQNEAFFKVMQLEKWMGFAITSLMLILMAFNTIGALWMIVLDKQKDISILKSMGATDGMIHRIFLLEGLLLTFFGMVAGILLALILYAAQKQFGLIPIPPGFLVDAYPIALRGTDFVPVVSVVMGIGLLAALLPARRAVQVPAFLREE